MDTTKCNVSTLQPGDFLSTTVYYTVTDIKDNGDVRVVDEDGKSLTISKDIVARESYSAQQFTEDKVANRTDMVKVLQNAGDTIFTVKFKKKGQQRPNAGWSSSTRVARHVLWSDQCIGNGSRTTAAKAPNRPSNHFRNYL